MTADEVRVLIAEKITGVWKPEHDESGHHYRNTKTGVLVDSVTTQNILRKDNLIPWACGLALEHFVARMQYYVPDAKDESTKGQNEKLLKSSKLAWRDVRDNAGDIGTKAHNIIEAYVKEWIATGVRRADIRTMLTDDMDHRIWAACRSAEQLFNDHPEIVPVATEILVGSDKIPCAGALDLLVLIDGELYILDWKTSNQVHPEDYAIQTAAYAAFFMEMSGLKIAGTVIALLEKGFARTKLYDVPYSNRAYAAFKHQNAIYLWQKNDKPKLIERKNRLVIKN